MTSYNQNNVKIGLSILFLTLSFSTFADDTWRPTLQERLDLKELPKTQKDHDYSLSDEFKFAEDTREAPELFPLGDLPLKPIIAADTPPPPAAPPATTNPSPLTEEGNPAKEQKLEAAPNDLTPLLISGSGPLEDPSKGILINFNNVNVIEFIRFISRVSNKNFIFDDQDLQFNVTIVSEEPTSLPNIMTALMQILRVHGLLLMEQGNNIVIHRNKAINQISQVVNDKNVKIQEGGALPQNSELVTRVFRLNTLDATQASAILLPLVSEGALVEVLQDTNHIVVTDIATNVDKINELIESLDAPNSGLTIGQYVVVNGLIDSLITLAEQMMDPMVQGKPLVFVAHTPSNSIFIVSTPFLVDRSMAILKKLDINSGKTQIFSPDDLRYNSLKNKPLVNPQEEGKKENESEESYRARIKEYQDAVQKAEEEAEFPKGKQESTSPWAEDLPAGHIEKTKFYIHKLRFRKGDQIVDALGRIGLSLAESGNGNGDLISSIQSIQWLEASNSLVFTGTNSSIGKVKELIEEIDTPLRQVFIEMLIMDTTLTDSLLFGVNFSSRFNEGDVAGGQSFLTNANTLAAALDTAVPSVVTDATSLLRDSGYRMGIIGRHITHCGVEFSSIGGLVRALHDKEKREILMNPKILVEDNATAEIFVGTNTSFQTQAISNDRGQIITNNYEYRDVGTTLKVTPLISNDGMVTLDIKEEVSSIVSNPVQSNSNLSNTSPGPTTRQSRTTTKVHVPNKYFLVMSGMLQNDYRRRRQQVPCLGGAPLIGGLFSDKEMNDEKRNLMIFIRPQIVDTVQEIDNLTRHQQDVYRNSNRSKKMWKYEVEEALDLLNVKESDVSLGDTEQYNP